MSDPIPCKFKREANNDNFPIGDWEEGSIYGFTTQGQYAIPAAIISAKCDCASLVIPLARVAFTTGDPDAIKAAYAKDKALKEAREKSGLDPTGAPVVHPFTQTLPTPASHLVPPSAQPTPAPATVVGGAPPRYQ